MRILVVSFSDLSSDPRVARQIEALRQDHEVVAAGTHAPSQAVEFIAIPAAPTARSVRWPLMCLMGVGLHSIARAADPSLSAARAALSSVRFDCILANDVYALPLCFSLAAGRPVVLDAHEYSPREVEDLWWWRCTYGRFYTHLCEAYLPRVRGMTTVCDGIADEYARAFRVVRPGIVYNAPYFRDIAVGSTSPDAIRLVHHGAALPSRGIEVMIDTMALLDSRFTLDFFLTPSHVAYLDQLKARARTMRSIRFRDPVPMALLPEELSVYDVGVFLLQPTNFNYRMALPNKLFEFVQARLAIAIGPSPEMERVVRRHALGVVSSDFSARAFADALSSLTPERVRTFREASDHAARELSFEGSALILRQIVAAACA
jgi:glycosyltransferase involved in cell wall biosynthesis